MNLLCAPTLTGAYCQMCDRSNIAEEVYFVKSKPTARAHCKPCGDTLGTTVIMGAAGLFVLVLVLMIGARLRRHIPLRWVQLFRQTVGKATLKNKVKVVLGFYMIATKVHPQGSTWVDARSQNRVQTCIHAQHVPG